MSIYSYYENNDSGRGYPSAGTPMRSDAVRGIGTRRDSWYPGADGNFEPWSLPTPGGIGARWMPNYTGQTNPFGNTIIPTSPIGEFSTNDMTGAYILIGCLAAAIILPMLIKQ